jgi:uncharacterized protein
MQFEWDELKSEACFQERGFDFEYAIQAFFDPHRITIPDLRYDYGEDRFELLARIDGRVFVLIYTLRADIIRIISARKANAKKVYQYENN